MTMYCLSLLALTCGILRQFSEVTPTSVTIIPPTSPATATPTVSSVASTSKIESTMTAKMPNPSVSVGSEIKPATIFIIVLTLSNEPWEKEYASKSSNEFRSFANNLTEIMKTKVFAGAMYDVANVSVVNLEDDDGKVKVTINITFGSNLSAKIVIDKRVLEVAASKTSDLVSTAIEVTVKGVTRVNCEDWVPKSDECKNKCCDGGGGPIIVERECKALKGGTTDRAFLEKTDPSCTVHCKENCNSGSRMSASVFLVFVAIILAIA